MLKTLIIPVMSLFSIFSSSAKPAPSFPSETIAARDGSNITLTFYAHASISIEWNGRRMYFDPAGEQIDWKKLPKADIVCITHHHYDHFDIQAVDALRKDDTEIVCDRTTAESFEHACITMLPGGHAEPMDGIRIDAVPAYNITDGHTNFHPQARQDCGYIVTVGGTRIYVAGDTEDNADVLAIRDIDVAFLPVNQPYTMTVDQAVRVVEQIRPSIFYPYHYGGTDIRTDVDDLSRRLTAVTEVRIRPLE